MISNYEIKKNNNEDILYLYIDLSNEFAIKKWQSQSKEMKEKIKDFIKENKIVFTGTMVAIIINGLFVGNIFLNDSPNSIIKDNNVAINSVIIDELIEDSVSNIKIETVKDTEKNIEQSQNESVNINNQITENLQNQTNKIQSDYKENIKKTNTEEVKETHIEDNAENDKIEDNNIYVLVKKSNGEIITLELEEYIFGVVSAEMPAEFNEQALMAQAIIARTYTLKALSRSQILTDNEGTQSYKDNNYLKNLWGSKYDFYYSKIKNAVEKTKGISLTYNNDYIEAVYHSTSNGQTENASNVWGNNFPYLISVESPYDTSNKSFIMEKNISYQELSTKLNMEITIDTNFNILDRTEGNRVKNITVNDKTFTGVNFRNLLGLRSADFEITKTDTGIIFQTKGYGHGVGLSQYGANGMANAGYSYEQILYHYYPGVTINHK